MGKIYAGQSDLTIKLTTSKDLTGFTDVKILYKNPNGIFGEFPAVVVDALTGVIQYAVTSINDLNIAGSWSMWAKTTSASGLISYGEPAIFAVNVIGT
jgi:hypothetical protein